MSKTYKIGAHEITLSPPAKFSIRHEIVTAAASNPARAFAAALAACWRGPGAPKVKYAACGYNALTFGGEVIDELHGRGVDMEEILDVGGDAWKLMSETILKASEVKAAEGFTAGQEGPPTS